MTKIGSSDIIRIVQSEVFGSAPENTTIFIANWQYVVQAGAEAAALEFNVVIMPERCRQDYFRIAAWLLTKSSPHSHCADHIVRVVHGSWCISPSVIHVIRL